MRRVVWSATATCRKSPRRSDSILIRRTKDKVLKELPERMEKRFFVPMTKEQMEYHEENRETVARAGAKMAQVRFFGRGRPTADAHRPAKHADVVQQHVSCWTRRPTTA